MNTLTHKNGFLKAGKNRILFEDKDLDFGMPRFQEREILHLWRKGKSVNFISKKVKRNPHEVFFTLYEYWMDGVIDDIEKAFAKGSCLLVPGKDLIKGG